MALFVAIGFAGVLLLVLSLVFDGVADIFDAGEGLISGPAVASFVGAFGFTGALAVRSGLSAVAAIPVGALGGLAAGALAGFAARALMRMPTDASVSDSSYVGASGYVVTGIAEGSLGEVSVAVAGQPQKLSARSADGSALAAGCQVRVVAAPSSTLVLVEPTGPGADADAGV